MIRFSLYQRIILQELSENELQIFPVAVYGMQRT